MFGGAEGTRTPDPLHAMEVRYQLRYSPVVTRSRVSTRPSLATPPPRDQITLARSRRRPRGRADDRENCVSW